jgi:ComF family protein
MPPVPSIMCHSEWIEGSLIDILLQCEMCLHAYFQGVSLILLQQEMYPTMGIFTKFLELIYPPRCQICQCFLMGDKGEISHFCTDCLKSLVEITSPLCPICGTPFVSRLEKDHYCGDCLKKRPFFDALAAPYLYEGGIMDAIHQIKYGGKTYLADSIGGFLGHFAMERFGDTRGLLMMPVPLHPRRLKERGFNQSLVLARAIAPGLEARVDFLSLRRVKYTQPQTGLKKVERQKNVKGAFGLAGRPDLKGKTVILVDDVATTGSTLNECAKVLKKAGCKKIFCLVLARTANL